MNDDLNDNASNILDDDPDLGDDLGDELSLDGSELDDDDIGFDDYGEFDE